MTRSRPRSVAVSRTSIVRLDGVGLDADGLAVGLAGDLAELAVEEDPVVELAAPAAEVGVADQPADLREAARNGRPVDGHPAASGGGASMTSMPWSSAVARAPSVSATATVWRSSVESRTVVGRARTQPPAGDRSQAASPRSACPYWPSSRSVATYASQRKSVPVALTDEIDGAARSPIDRADATVRRVGHRRSRGDGAVARRRDAAVPEVGRAETRSDARAVGVAQAQLVGDGGRPRMPARPRASGPWRSPLRGAPAAGGRAPPNSRRAWPKPGEEARADEREQPRVGGLQATASASASRTPRAG